MDGFINRFYFSWASCLVHTLWFIVWFWLKLDVGLLTNIVSLEAIYLCLFIGISQKGHHERLHDKLDEVVNDG